MARYITPARICTLLLIQLYREQPFWSYAPETSSDILKIVARQCLPPVNDDNDTSPLEHQDESQDVLSFAKKLSHLDTVLPGRPWSSTLLQKTWSLKTVDELHDLFESCSGLLASPSLADSQPTESQADAITRASPFGQFIRRCYVDFTRLQFADIIVLWKSFLLYREPSRQAWAQHFPDAARQLHEIETQDALLSISDLRTSSTAPNNISTDGAEAILAASVAQLQKIGQRVSPELKAKIEEWLSAQHSNSLQSMHNFMAFFDAWRAGQYNVALESLHRYFDYAVAKEVGEEMKTHYQYALLHLSVLHADFEHWEESINAMRECIATARENQDATCLNFALSWLMYLRQSRHTRALTGLSNLAAIAGEGGSEKEELAFLKSKAREGKHWTLMSSTLLEEARLEMRHHGVSAKSLEMILQSSYLNTQHALQSLMPATVIFEAASFDRLGQSHLSRWLYEELLSKDTKHISLGDRTRLVCRLAYDRAQRGLYDDSLATLQDLKSAVQGTLKLEQKVVAYAEVIGLMRAIRRCDLYAAQYHMTNLRPARSNADPDLANPIDNLEILLLTKQNRLDTASEKISDHLDHVKANGSQADVAEFINMLIHKANLFVVANHGLKGFSIILKAIAAAREKSLLGLLVDALRVFSRILSELGEYQAARDLTQAVLPYALEMSNTFVTAQLFVSLGEAFVGLATEQDQASESKHVQLLRTASKYIDRGRKEYARIQEYDGQLDCLLMKARLARCTGDETIADQADGMYQQLVVDHEELLRR